MTDLGLIVLSPRSLGVEWLGGRVYSARGRLPFRSCLPSFPLVDGIEGRHGRSRYGGVCAFS